MATMRLLFPALLFAALALFAPGLASPALAAPDALPAAAQAADATPKPAYLQEDQPLQLRDYDEPKKAEDAPWWQQLFGFIFKLAIVVGLIFLSLAVVKKLSGGRVALPTTKGRNMVLLESTSLGPQQAIHLVSLGGDRLLVVGASPQGLTRLTEVTEPHEVQALLAGTKGQSSAFNQVFDLEAVVQASNSELISEALREARAGEERTGA